MEQELPKISLEQEGDGFMLRKTAGDGSITSMFLSDDDVLTLIQSVPSYSSRILSKRSPSGADYSAVFVTEVARIGLHEDALGESILLSLYAPSGANQTYALSKDIAVALSDRLPIRLAEMQASRPKEQ